jgi:hypothetical protein
MRQYQDYFDAFSEQRNFISPSLNKQQNQLELSGGVIDLVNEENNRKETIPTIFSSILEDISVSRMVVKSCPKRPRILGIYL